MMTIRPQAGRQEEFLSTSADVVFYGGSAGGGKTYALLLEPLRHVGNKNFSATIFRRNSTDITKQGGLWDEALNIYPLLGARGVQSPNHYFIFPSGMRVAMEHLQYDNTVYGYQGSQIPLIMFDELTHFSWKQFTYMFTRNRSARAGIKPYVRATTNPDPDSWVADFIKWYIDQESGFAIPERSGVIRYFAIWHDVAIWGSTFNECKELLNKQGAPPEMQPKSFTFIRASIHDNQILMTNDPGYLANLYSQDDVTRGQLLEGNWKIRPAAGLYFKANQAPIVNIVPGKINSICRSWDLAATEETAQNKSPDKTAGVLIARLDNGKFIILDAKGECLSASAVRQMIRSTANADRINYKCNTLTIPQDPGQAGKEQAQSYVRFLSGFNIKTHTVSGSKIKRAEPFAAQWQAGNVMLLKGDWNRQFVNELVGFPDALHDDFVDAAADAFNDVCVARDWSAFID